MRRWKQRPATAVRSPWRLSARVRLGAGGRWSLAWLSADGQKLLLTRVLRTFAYGYLGVVLALYLDQLGLDGVQIGLVLTAALAGSALMNVFWSIQADNFGRRRTVITLAVLMAVGGLIFALTDNFWLLLLGGFTGTISVANTEVGPFLTVEQAILPQTAADDRRTWLFSLYDMLGSFAGALGALFAGSVAFFAALGLHGADVYRPLFVVYAAVGGLNVLVFLRLSDRVERDKLEGKRTFLGIHRSAGTITKLSLLMSLDAFAGGLVVQSLMAYWLHLRWGLSAETLGVVFFCVNVIAGLSFLGVGPLAARIGLLNTMVFTHLPSSIVLLLVPLAPTPWLAVLLILLRACTSQMDVPTRKSYSMAVVDADERTATAGIINTARTIASAFSPVLSGLAFGIAALGLPFFIAGGLKVVYDGLIYAAFRDIRPPEEERIVARRKAA
jgi:MFS family permease